jgi:hypothetical protein
MSRSTGTRSAALGILMVALVLAGCSSKKTPAKAGASSTPATSAPTSATDSTSSSASPSATNSFKGDPAMIALASQSLVALSKVKSVHVVGTSTQDGATMKLDLTFANGKGALGSISVGGGTFKLLAVDKDVYIQGDAAAFANVGQAVPSQALSAIAGKWIKIGKSDASGPFGDFGGFADFSQFSQQFAGDGGTLSAAGKKTINGKAAIGILDTTDDASGSSTLYVAADGDHLPLEVVPVESASSAATTLDKIDFLEYNAPVTITAPTGAIDLSELAKLFSPSPSAVS